MTTKNVTGAAGANGDNPNGNGFPGGDGSIGQSETASLIGRGFLAGSRSMPPDPTPAAIIDRHSARCYPARMTKDEILARLAAQQAELRRRGVLHAALFGSRARGEARAESDTDIMIEIDPEAKVGVWQYSGLITTISALFDGKVDVVDRKGLPDQIARSALADAIYAF